MRRPRVLGMLGVLGLVVSGCATYAPGPAAPRGPGTTSGAGTASGADSTSRVDPTNGASRPGSDIAAGARVPPEAGPAARSGEGGGASALSTNRASLLLLDESQAARRAGDYARAATVVERALAIDPNEAVLWIELAEIRFAQGDVDEARTLARKAVTLAGSDRSIATRAERLTAR